MDVTLPRSCMMGGGKPYKSKGEADTLQLDDSPGDAMKLLQAGNPLLATFLLLAATHCAIQQSGLAGSNQPCRPINATIAAEKDDCPVCMAITTSICSGYCKTKEMLWKPLFSFSQKVCIYKEVQYETTLLQGCPPDVDPTFTYPVALSCHCGLCNMDSSDCTVQGTGPDFCSNQNRLT